MSFIVDWAIIGVINIVRVLYNKFKAFRHNVYG